MVLFIYISRLAYNEKFKILNKEFFYQILIIFIITLPIIIFYETKTPKSTKLEIREFIFKIYSSSSAIITSLTIIYLIITLVVVVKITSQFSGPLRSKR